MNRTEEERAKRVAAKKYVDEYDAGSCVKGIFGALTGALAGTVPWIMFYGAGCLTSWLAILTVILASRGYDSAGGKKTILKVLIVGVAAAIGILAGNIAGDMVYVVSDGNMAALRREYGVDVIGFYCVTLGTFVKTQLLRLVEGLAFAAFPLIRVWVDVAREELIVKRLRLEVEKE